MTEKPTPAKMPAAVTEWVLKQISEDEYLGGSAYLGLRAEECAEAREVTAAFQDLLWAYCDREGIDRWMFSTTFLSDDQGLVTETAIRADQMRQDADMLETLFADRYSQVGDQGNALALLSASDRLQAMAMQLERTL